MLSNSDVETFTYIEAYGAALPDCVKANMKHEVKETRKTSTTGELSCPSGNISVTFHLNDVKAKRYEGWV